MTDFFTKLYPDASSGQNSFVQKIRIYSLFRFIIRHLANNILPIYYKITKGKYRLNKSLGEDSEPELIVSFTSFPARIKKVHLVVETILRQTVLPDKIILWLSKKQFPTEGDIPLELLELKHRGLEIYICEGDLRSYKKYYYTIEKYPDCDFIIIDDDTFYPSDTIETLVKFHEKYPDCVCFNKGRRVTVKENKIQEYITWNFLLEESEPSYDIMATGVGGVYYPAGVLHDEVLDKELFMNVCEYADDIWLYAMTLLNCKKLVKTDNNKLFLPIFNKNNFTLTSLNVNESLNDEQLRELRSYFKKNNRKDPFTDKVL